MYIKLLPLFVTYSQRQCQSSKTKPLKLWPRKRQKKKKKGWGIEGGIEEIDKNKLLKKLDSDSYMFQKFEIWSVERNQARIENNIKIGSIGVVESRQPETFKRKSIFLLHISIDRRKDLIGQVSKKRKFWKF